MVTSVPSYAYLGAVSSAPLAIIKVYSDFAAGALLAALLR